MLTSCAANCKKTRQKTNAEMNVLRCAARIPCLLKETGLGRLLRVDEIVRHAFGGSAFAGRLAGMLIEARSRMKISLLRPVLVFVLVSYAACAPISKIPATPRVRDGSLARASAWAAQARRDPDARAASAKCLAALRAALAEDSSSAREIANAALGRLIEADFYGLNPRHAELEGPDGRAYRINVVTGADGWPRRLLAGVKPIRPTPSAAADPLRRAGWGVPVIGVCRSDRADEPFAPRQGYRLPVTVVADIHDRGKVSEVAVRLLNPQMTKTVTIGGEARPLAFDLLAPGVASFRRGNPLVESLRWLFMVDRFSYPTNLIFLQPYDSRRIPVVLVHGLLSTPAMWGEVVRALEADPLIRKKFQFWAFYYPTGQPIPVSALDLRNDLRAAEARYKPSRGIVLVGHSMGGILSRAQASGSGGRAIFDEVFVSDAPRVAERLDRAPLLRDALIFERDKNVRRAVFISTPHRGSTIALAGPVGFVTSLIRLPGRIADSLQEVADVVTTLDLRRPPTSISGLSPRSPFLRALDRLPVPVPHHTILGDRGRGNFSQSSDGVVAYSSGSLGSAASELVVPTGHGSFRHPKAIAELRRILLAEAARSGP